MAETTLNNKPAKEEKAQTEEKPKNMEVRSKTIKEGLGIVRISKYKKRFY